MPVLACLFLRCCFHAGTCAAAPTPAWKRWVRTAHLYTYHRPPNLSRLNNCRPCRPRPVLGLGTTNITWPVIAVGLCSACKKAENTGSKGWPRKIFLQIGRVGARWKALLKGYLPVCSPANLAAGLASRPQTVQQSCCLPLQHPALCQILYASHLQNLALGLCLGLRVHKYYQVSCLPA